MDIGKWEQAKRWLTRPIKSKKILTDEDYGPGYRPRSIPDNFVPVMPQAPGPQDPATSVKELATGGRIGFDRGGLAQVFNYLESLPKGTELSISDIMKYVEDNNIDIARSTLEARLQSPESKMFSTEEKIRNKNILKNIKLKVERPNVFGDITTKKIKEVFENPTKYPDQKSVSKALGYRSTQSKSFLKNLYESRVGPLYDYRFDVGYRPDYGIGKKISESYQNQLKLYGKSNLMEIGKQIFPNRNPFDSQKIVKKFVKNYEGYISPEPLPRKKGRPDRSKIRKQKLFGGGEEKISSKQVEAQLAAPKKSGYQMHHGDATKIKNVTLNNLFYVPEKINNFLQKAEGPINKIEKEIQELIKKKPKDYKTKISSKNAQAMNLMTKASNDLKKLGFERYFDLLEFNSVDESGKPIKLGGRSANRSLAIFAEELGIDPNKPIKNFTQKEINKVKTLRDTYLIPEDKKLFNIDVKGGANYEKVTGPTYKKSGTVSNENLKNINIRSSLEIKPTDTKSTILSKIKKSPLPSKVKNVLLATVGGYGAMTGADFLKSPVSANEAQASEVATTSGSMLPEAVAAGTGAATLGTKIGRKILGTALNVGLGPTGVAALIYGFRPEDGYDFRRAGDRLTFEAEAALANPIVKGALSVTDKIKNPLARKAAERASLALMSPAMALRLARVATPLGIASLGGEALYGYGKWAKGEIERVKNMTPEERAQYNAEQQEQMGVAAANGGLINLTRTTPPERGPQSQGLAYLRKHGRGY
jgi:hypothetical protein